MMIGRYILKTGAFIGAFLCALIGVYFATMPRYSDDLFKFPSSKNILVAGDSRTALAVDDTIFSRAINVSNPAELYVYTYGKLKKILPLNPQIDTLLLSFSHYSLSQLTAHWRKDVPLIRARLPRYAPILTFSEISDLAAIAPLPLVEGLSETIRTNVMNKPRHRELENFRDIDIGGYNPMAGEIAEWWATVTVDEDAAEKLSIPFNIQLKYLEEIAALCKERNVTLILFTLPIHKSNRFRSMTASTLQKFSPDVANNVTLMDYSAMEFPDSCYRDYLHFNPRGAAIFSKLLQENGITR